MGMVRRPQHRTAVHSSAADGELRAAAVAGHCGGARAARGEHGKAGGRDGADRQAGADGAVTS